MSAVLKWDMKRLAGEASVAKSTVYRFETGRGVLATNLRKIQVALEGAGIEFTDSGKPGLQWNAD